MTRKPSAPDFREVVHRVREFAASCRAAPGEFWASANALRVVRRELGAQAFASLYWLLTQGEQWREAAMLIAYAMPHDVRSDPRVREVIEHAAGICEGVRDPETESARIYTAAVHRIEDEHAANLLTVRGEAWLGACRLLGARTAIEFGTGAGAHVLYAARTTSGARWIGLDLNEDQIAANREQAQRLGLDRAEFYTHPEPSLAGAADVVGVLDVLEHTVYPDETLSAAESYLRPGGMMVVTVPLGAWAPAEDSIKNAGPGQHLAVESRGTLAARLRARGELVHIAVNHGDVPPEGNASIFAAYRPRRAP